MAVRRNHHRYQSHRTLTREEELAHLICSKVHDARCACKEGSPSTCSRMVFVAKHAIRFVEGLDPNQASDR